MNGTTRLSVEISPRLDAILERLSQDMCTSKADVLRKGIALVSVVVDGSKRGLKFGLASDESKLDVEIVGI